MIVVYSKSDLEMCKDSIVYLLSLSCKGKFCKDCKYSQDKHGTCLKADLRDVMSVRHPYSTELKSLDEVYDLIESIKQSVDEGCNLSGTWCRYGCPFTNTDGNCTRIKLRELLRYESI
jgi:hypothetical protein